MMFDPTLHHRQSIRLRTHDYAAGGMYYVTMCAEERRRLFGVVVNGRMALNEAGRMVSRWFAELINKFPDVRLDAFVCMPNHMHFVVGTGRRPDETEPVRTDAGTDVGTAVGANLCVRPPVDAEPKGVRIIGSEPAVREEGEHAGSPGIEEGEHVGSPGIEEGEHAGSPGIEEGEHARLLGIEEGEHAGSPGIEEGEHVGSPLRNIVAWFKTMTTNEYIRGVKQHGWPPFPGKLWQRNYYEHIVRDDADLVRIRAYIHANPANWDVLRYGEPRFMIGNRALLDLPKTAYLASRGGDGRTRDGRTRDGRTHRFAPTDGTECLISGFLSPMERAVFDACLAEGTRMIQVLACGLPKIFPPRVQRAIDAGRLLVMTPFDETVARVNAERAAWCNQYLLHAADRVVIGHLNPEGMLACLLSDMPDDKPIVFAVGATGGSPTGGVPKHLTPAARQWRRDRRRATR